jgi:hypothetical protein
MSVESAVRLWAGFLIIVSLLLYMYHSVNWLYFTAFIGLNLIQSSFTGFCPAEKIIKKLFFSKKAAI